MSGPSENPVSSTVLRCARSPGEGGRTRVNEQEATPLADPYRSTVPEHARTCGRRVKQVQFPLGVVPGWHPPRRKKDSAKHAGRTKDAARREGVGGKATACPSPHPGPAKAKGCVQKTKRKDWLMAVSRPLPRALTAISPEKGLAYGSAISPAVLVVPLPQRPARVDIPKRDKRSPQRRTQLARGYTHRRMHAPPGPLSCYLLRGLHQKKAQKWCKK